MRVRFLVFVLITCGLGENAADAQWRDRVAAYQDPWETAKLELAWQTTVASSGVNADGVRATTYVSPDRVRKIYEVVQDGKRTVFAPHHVDSRGRQLGDEGAQWQANLLQRTLAAQNIEAAVDIREVPDISLLVQNDAGLVQNLDAETGALRWTVAVGSTVFRGWSASANDEFVASVNGTTLYVISVATGKLVFERELGGWPATGPILSPTHAFVPLTDGAVEAYALSAEDRRLPAKRLVSFGQITDRPLLTPGGLGWVTGRGSLYIADWETMKARFRVQARDDLVGGPAYAKGDRWFVASNDGFLTCIDGTSERILWEFSTGDAISNTPFVTGELVLASTLGGRLYAVEIETGHEAWTVTNVSQVIAQTNGHLYAAERAGEIRILDAATGQNQGRFNLPARMRPLVNPDTNRLYLLSAGGTLVCLRPEGEPWPTIYTPLLPSATADETAPTTERTTEPSTAAPTDERVADQDATAAEADAMANPDDDPFGGVDPFDAGGDDPFGGADKPGDNMNEGDDPFGGAGAASDDDDDPFG